MGWLFHCSPWAKNEDNKVYFLVLGANGSSTVYDNKWKYVSSSKYYNIREGRFIGENGWEAWPGTENNSMVVRYQDEKGALKEFYHGCLLKKSF